MSKMQVWRPEDDAEEQQQERKTGTIKFYAKGKEYGFITQEEDEDLFFHFSRSGIEDPNRLSRGCVVSYEVTEGDKGLEAGNLTIEKEAEPKAKKTEKAFWDKHIQEGNTLSVMFIDGIEVEAVLTGYDRYYVFVEVDGKERMIAKHALKWVEEA